MKDQQGNLVDAEGRYMSPCLYLYDAGASCRMAVNYWQEHDDRRAVREIDDAIKALQEARLTVFRRRAESEKVAKDA